MKSSRFRALSAALPCLLALTLGAAACGDQPDDPAGGLGDEQASDGAEPPADDQQPPSADDDANGAAGGTTMRVYNVSEAASAEGEGSVHVSGLLIDDGSGWRLCEMAMESHPPQCAGEELAVDGLDAADLPLEESGGVSWQSEATLVGEIDGDTLTITGSPAAS